MFGARRQLRAGTDELTDIQFYSNIVVRANHKYDASTDTDTPSEKLPTNEVTLWKK